jgi:hypothetical protein
MSILSPGPGAGQPLRHQLDALCAAADDLDSDRFWRLARDIAGSAAAGTHDPLLCGISEDCPGCVGDRAAGHGDAWEHPADRLGADDEARQRYEDRELTGRLCGQLRTSPELLTRALLRLLAPGIAEIADAGGDR